MKERDAPEHNVDGPHARQLLNALLNALHLPRQNETHGRGTGCRLRKGQPQFNWNLRRPLPSVEGTLKGITRTRIPTAEIINEVTAAPKQRVPAPRTFVTVHFALRRSHA